MFNKTNSFNFNLFFVIYRFLNDNQFTGEINDSLANLNQLEYL